MPSEPLATGQLSLHWPNGNELDVAGYERQSIDLIEAPETERGTVMNAARIEFAELDERVCVSLFGLWLDGEVEALTHLHREITVPSGTHIAVREGDAMFSDVGVE